MDFTQIKRNPYDFANPVNKKDLFAGREAELRDIEYYLNHGSASDHPIHLALIGARASGKTSLLNMIAIEAAKQDFCVVRIDLDEGDAHSQLAFFQKLFDALFTTVCEQGAFGGDLGDAYLAYRDMIDAHKIPADRSICPFIFPIQFARAKESGSLDSSVSDTAFKRDIAKISQAVGRPIALLFDECDVLKNCAIHLEKLRNIFMNATGYMLVFTGTQALFPMISDVFSPIVRQFKKINVGPFEKADDTSECIRKPLHSLGILEPESVFDPETYFRMVHEVTGDRPYEIQLLCHFMFKRLQEGSAKKMKLTLNVLDDVRRELEKTQDVESRPVLSVVRNLSRRELQALDILCSCSHANLDQIWYAEFVFRDKPRRTKEELTEYLTTFRKLGIVDVDANSGHIIFKGEDFDRIYCKYFARQHRVSLSLNDMPYEYLLSMGLNVMLQKVDEDVKPLGVMFVGRPEQYSIEQDLRGLSDPDCGDNPFRSSSTLAEAMYWYYFDFQNCQSLQVCTVNISSPWASFNYTYRLTAESGNAQAFQNLQDRLERVATRARRLGGDIEVQMYTLPVVPMSVLVEKVIESEDDRLRTALAIRHDDEVRECYLENHDIDLAWRHGELSFKLDPQRSANNFGYLCLVSDRLERARELFEYAFECSSTSYAQALALYNLGVTSAKQGELRESLAYFHRAADLSEPLERDDRSCACLIVPVLEAPRALVFEEQLQPDLLYAAHMAVSVTEYIVDGGPEDS